MLWFFFFFLVFEESRLRRPGCFGVARSGQIDRLRGLECFGSFRDWQIEKILGGSNVAQDTTGVPDYQEHGRL